MTDFDPELLEMLACPETKEPVHLADAALIDRLNAAQREGRLKNRAGRPVEQPLQEGFIREDKAYLYPVVDGIPVMLIDEAILLEGFV
jgi:uncharacterized protein